MGYLLPTTYYLLPTTTTTTERTTTQTSYPSQCYNYNELKDKTRKKTYGYGPWTDTSGRSQTTDFQSGHVTSPDRKGPSWYRVVYPAGTRLLDGNPGGRE